MEYHTHICRVCAKTFIVELYTNLSNSYSKNIICGYCNTKYDLVVKIIKRS